MSTKQDSKGILVVGAGIGGLTLAAFLRQSGRPVVVIDRAPELAAVGAGILLHSNSLKVLSSLGIDSALESQGVVLESAVILNTEGTTLSEVSFADEIRQGKKTVGVHRATLQSALRSKIEGVEVRLGLTVSSLNVGARSVDVYFSDGSHGCFGLVVGADGVHSRTREQLFGAVPLRPTGTVCWRVVLPRPASIAADRTGEQLGSGIRAGWVPIDGSRLYAFFVANAPPGDAEARALDVAGLKAKFASLGGAGAAILGALPANAPLLFDELGDLWIETWHRGRVLLLGDAAHAMTPNLGQGAAMAIEDAKALQYALDQNNEVSDALVYFEKLRRDRVRAIHDASFDAGRINQWSNGAAVSFRNLLYRMLPADVSRSRLRALIDGGDQVREFLAHRPDLPPLSEASRRLVHYLVKLGQIDGRFDDDERAFIQANLQSQGEHVGLDEIEAISVELHKATMQDVLAPFQGADAAEAERLLELGYLAAMANGHVALRERKALDEVRQFFGLSREAFERVTRSTLG